MSDATEENLRQLPQLEIPLTDEELRDLGVFTATFSQIDFQLGEAISMVTKTPFWAMMIMLDSSTTGPKLSAFRKAIKNLEDEKTKELGEKIVDRMNSLIDKRNHVIHGLWARYIIIEQKTQKPACFYNRNVKNPVFPDDLRNLTRRGMAVTRLLGELIDQLSPVETAAWTHPQRMHIFSENVDELPDWVKVEGEPLRRGYPNPGEGFPKRSPSSKPPSGE